MSAELRGGSLVLGVLTVSPLLRVPGEDAWELVLVASVGIAAVWAGHLPGELPPCIRAWERPQCSRHGRTRVFLNGNRFKRYSGSLNSVTEVHRDGIWSLNASHDTQSLYDLAKLHHLSESQLSRHFPTWSRNS